MTTDGDGVVKQYNIKDIGCNITAGRARLHDFMVMLYMSIIIALLILRW